jgi:hypothetical protein
MTAVVPEFCFPIQFMYIDFIAETLFDGGVAEDGGQWLEDGAGRKA